MSYEKDLSKVRATSQGMCKEAVDRVCAELRRRTSLSDTQIDALMSPFIKGVWEAGRRIGYAEALNKFGSELGRMRLFRSVVAWVFLLSLAVLMAYLIARPLFS